METAEPLYGEIVEIPWGPRHTVRATVHEVYGQPDRRHVVVLLTPEVSGYIVDKPTTLSLSIAKVTRSLSDWPHRGRRRRAGVLRWRNNNLGNKPIWGSAWRLIWDIIGAVNDSRRSIHGRRLSRA